MTANLPTDAAERKKLPVFSGVLAYFPDAIAAIAEVSYKGNEQHNPGEPLHWAREKSTDHEDCIVRHLLELGFKDKDGVRHAAKLAWRALAVLQLEIEAGKLTGPSQPTTEIQKLIEPIVEDFNANPPPTVKEIMSDSLSPWACDCDTCRAARSKRPTRVEVPTLLDDLDQIDRLALEAQNTPNVKVKSIETSTPQCYEIGPMTGYDQLNFPMFDQGEEILIELGWDMISPANLDRMAGIDPTIPGMEAKIAAFTIEDRKTIIRRDMKAILSLDPDRGDAIALLPGWERSTGSMAEVMLGRWLGLRVIHALSGEPVAGFDVDYPVLCAAIHDYLQGKAGLR